MENSNMMIMKKIISFGMMLCMMFCFFGCGGHSFERASSFPSIVEEFGIEDFNEEFFESYTLITLSFTFGSTFPAHKLNFYTIFIERGRVNFLMELNTGATGVPLGEAVPDSRRFAVIIPNKVLEKYEIGSARMFLTYDRSDNENPVENCRRWLRKIERNSVQHRVVQRCAKSVLGRGWYNWQDWNYRLEDSDTKIVLASGVGHMYDRITITTWQPHSL
jgi:hypothetical protein